MYQEIENLLVRTLSPFEYEKLEQLKNDYTEQQIIDAYKESSVKNINYITKVLQNKTKVVPTWLNQEIENQEIDEETKTTFDDFQKFIKEIRNDTSKYI